MKKGTLTGATRVVEKQPRQWHWPKINVSWIIVPLLFVSLVMGGRWLYQSWPIQSVEVEGQFSLWQPDLIVQQLTWLKSESFFSVDLQQVYQQVDELPLIHVKRVKKSWPGTIVINVHEDIPMAIWNGEEILTVAGDILPRPGFVSGEKMARMRGSSQYAHEAMRNYRRLHQMLKKSRVNVLELEVTEVGSISVLLSNSWKVEFGRQYFEERMKRLDGLLSTLPAEQVIAVDLRYGKGAAIQWHPLKEMDS
ncbi:cell division protein FtsQ/DivIB [Bacterioplanoides sp.]|uniref:cell division protein FtsQ/DivIB n=1 Tax=Bacterioplanoides sp. TaxID=2066072 RepID=UPI003B00A04B